MKKETVNVFNEGLNKDLNPIVTPNNVLTDNLNGTFITFNGDELSLQNDAGNTRIPVPETGDSVRLSEGFYPLGIKEYGGVLYIVSGKQGLNEFNQRDPNLDEIEFGSYPSPELASYTTFHGQQRVSLNKTTDKLYKSYVINNDYFKTGRYVKFLADPGFNLTHVWSPDNPIGLYEIKLLLQLDNGTIDLTDDVWDMFLRYRQNNPSDMSSHWLLSPDFIYHCPYSYKGKLVVQTTISEPVFEPVRYYDIVPESNGYNFKMDLRIEDTSALSIIKYRIEITTDKVLFQPKNIDVHNTIMQVNELIATENKIMHYKITPIFKVIATGQIIDWGELPFEFQDKYTIKGYVLLEERFFNIGFNLLEGTCAPERGERHYKALGLIGEKGYTTPLLNPITTTEKPYVFVEYGSDSPELRDRYTILGTYRVNIDTGIVQSVSPSEARLTIDGNNYEGTIEAFNAVDPSLWGVIETKLRQVQTVVLDGSCSEATITIEFSAPLEMATANSIKGGTLSFYQDGASGLLPYESWDGQTFTITANAAQPLTIQFEHIAFSSVRKTLFNLSSEVRYKIGLVFNMFNIGLGYQVVFYNNRIPQNMGELGEYITDMFGTNVANRLKLEKVETQYNFEFADNKIFFSRGNEYHNLSVQIKDPDFNPDRMFHYLYRILNGQKVLADEYINIDIIDATNDTGYIKLGTDHLGYLLFRREGSFIYHNINIDLSQIPHWA